MIDNLDDSSIFIVTPCAATALQSPKFSALVSGLQPRPVRRTLRRMPGPDLVSTQGEAAMRLSVLVLLAILLAACSDSTPVAPPSATESPAMVAKNCADPHWKSQNLGLWYSVCRQPMHW